MIAELLDFLWPRRCEVCGRPADRPGRHLCSDCLMRLPFVPRDGLCRRCGTDAAELKGEFLCEDCRVHKPAFDRAASALRFDVEARDLVNAYKFQARLWLTEDFVDFLEGMAQAHFKTNEIDLVVPMPSMALHRFFRGYNPCEGLACGLARRLGKPYDRTALKRVGRPKKQAGLDEDERRTNVLGTFAVRHPEAVKDRTVFVIDDIMTTGSTLSAAAAALKAAGAARVWCLTLARTPRLK